jgi:hypothetical protein
MQKFQLVGRAVLGRDALHLGVIRGNGAAAINSRAME